MNLNVDHGWLPGDYVVKVRPDSATSSITPTYVHLSREQLVALRDRLTFLLNETTPVRHPSFPRHRKIIR